MFITKFYTIFLVEQLYLFKSNVLVLVFWIRSMRSRNLVPKFREISLPSSGQVTFQLTLTSAFYLHNTVYILYLYILYHWLNLLTRFLVRTGPDLPPLEQQHEQQYKGLQFDIWSSSWRAFTLEVSQSSVFRYKRQRTSLEQKTASASADHLPLRTAESYLRFGPRDETGALNNCVIEINSKARRQQRALNEPHTSAFRDTTPQRSISKKGRQRERERERARDSGGGGHRSYSSRHKTFSSQGARPRMSSVAGIDPLESEDDWIGIQRGIVHMVHLLPFL